MGQFKPMVKMETTEPSIELKLKKGGSVAHKKMKSDTSSGHKPMKKMMDGGVMEALASTPALVRAPVNAVAPVRRPARPSLAARKAAMAAGPRRIMKEGGKAEGKKTVAFLEKKGASKELVNEEKKEHGLKKGGKCYANGGIIKSESGKTKMTTAEYTGKSGNSTGDVKLGNGGGYKTGGVVKGNGGGYATGGVALGNAGGFKKGGKAKKAFANGGSVNDAGKAVSMPQGKKPASKPVSINRLSGTFKNGGKVTPAEGKLQKAFASENATAMREAKADSNLKYKKGGKVKKYEDGGLTTGDAIPLSAPEGNVTDTAYEAAMESDVNPTVMYATGAPAGGLGAVSDNERRAARMAANQARRQAARPRITNKAIIGAPNRDARNALISERNKSERRYPSGLTDSDIDRIINSPRMQERLGHDIDRKRGGKVGK